MASRGQQDSFIDDEEELCPLCVEEFDLSDRNFRPCPCGYQVCQFCFNNIRNNMNGLCPACRRPYDEKSIEWKVISPEEFKADLQKQARKKAELRQKEAQKKEVETTQRKHLAGLRVVQKNLVYIVGLNPRIREEDLLQTLRGEQYFGQYGKIIKIVVSKAKQGAHGPQPLGVYVTFARRQDAERCIAAVDGSDNEGRTLRAQFGTTKYCSSYLRNEQCMNKSCMFLHEVGEDKDSFTRQDLSSINVASTQRPAQSSLSGQANQQQALQSQPPLQSAPHAMPAAAQPMARNPSTDLPSGIADSTDASALPSSASWATKSQSAKSTSTARQGTTPSPQVKHTLPSSSQQHQPQQRRETPAENVTPEKQQPPSRQEDGEINHLAQAYRTFYAAATSKKKCGFNYDLLSPEDQKLIKNYPLLLDPDGPAKRRKRREAEQQRRQRDEEAARTLNLVTEPRNDEPAGSGSLQLGGEPEERRMDDSQGRDSKGSAASEGRRNIIQPPFPSQGNVSQFNDMSQPALSGALSNLSLNARGLTPAQQQQLLYLKATGSHNGNFADQLPQELIGQGQQLQSGLLPGQSQGQSMSSHGHTRQTSRFSFANDSSASAAVKPAANAKLMAQQSSMMPSGAGSTIHRGQPQQNAGNHFFGNSMPGPPPGLKSAGTPPVSGGGMFSQGHGFANSMGGGMNNVPQSAENKSELYREMPRNRGQGIGSAGSNPGLDMGKRESFLSSFTHQYPSASMPTPAPGFAGSQYGQQSGVGQDPGHQKQKKKGKKHRHANTSSYGGGGVVDLADPSILQARMQQAGASGSGQGLFGGQGQGNTAPSLGASAPSISPFADAVRGSGADVNTVWPLPGIRPSQHPQQASSNPLLSNDSPALDDKTIREDVKHSRDAVLSSSSSRNEAQDGSEFSTFPGPAEDDQKASADLAASGLSIQPQDNREGSVGVTSLGRTASELPKQSPIAPALPVKGTAQDSKRKETRAPSTQKLQLASPSDELEKQRPLTPEQTSKQGSSQATSEPLGSPVTKQNSPLTPGSAPRETSVSTARQVQPKTIRVVQKSKADLPSKTADNQGLPTPSALSDSRKASVASALSHPSTPVSELLSENVSLPSASASRASTPPGTRTVSGSAKFTSKNQAKKQRKEAKKEQEKKAQEEVEATQPKEEEEIAPIVGRKKKKAKPARAPGDIKEQPATETSSVAGDAPDPVKGIKDSTSSGQDKGVKVSKDVGAEISAENSDNKATKSESTSQKPTDSTAVSVLSDLVANGDLHPGQLEFFKSIPNINQRVDATSMGSSFLQKLTITADDQARLARGEALRFEHGPSKNAPESDEGNGTQSLTTMISPNGYLLRGLTYEQQERFLDLEQRIASDDGSGKFITARRGAENGFSMIANRVVQNNSDLSAGAHPATESHGSELSDGAASKMRGDEALSYINQFVLPALPRGTVAAQTASEELSSSTHHPRAPDPAAYSAYTSEAGEEGFGLGADVAGMMHGMVGIARPSASNLSGDADEDDALTLSAHGGQFVPAVPLLSVEEAETRMQAAKRETEGFEKKLLTLWKRNRRFIQDYV